MVTERATNGLRQTAGREAPLICLVTDRRRLARAMGRSEQESLPLVQEQIEGAVRARIQFVQIRERDLDARALLTLTRSLVRIAEGSGTRILVNDRLDVALASGADGVHLRADSPAPLRIKSAVADDFVISRAVHSVEDVAADKSAHIFVAGTMFPTSSKADKDTWLGNSGLAAIVQAADNVAVIAIGGVTESNLSEVAAVGARGLASIGGFLPTDSSTSIRAYVEQQTERFRTAFAEAGHHR